MNMNKKIIITYHLADAAEQRPTTPWIAGIRAGSGHGEDGFQESALSPPPLQPVFLESGTSHAELYD